MSKGASVAIALVVGLVAGYFAGREHIKYELRSAMAQAFGGLRGDSQDPAKASAARQEAAPAAAPTEKPRPQLVTVALKSKNFQARDFDKNILRDQILVELELSNQTDKPIKAFMGQLQFLDQFDRPIQRVNLTYEHGLAARETKPWKGGIDFNQFSSEDQRLATVDEKDLQVQLQIGQVIYADGAREKFGE